MLPRVIEAVRPWVLPKLREDKERARKKSTRKKNIKDVVVEGQSTHHEYAKCTGKPVSQVHSVAIYPTRP